MISVFQTDDMEFWLTNDAAPAPTSPSREETVSPPPVATPPAPPTPERHVQLQSDEDVNNVPVSSVL